MREPKLLELFLPKTNCRISRAEVQLSCFLYIVKTYCKYRLILPLSEELAKAMEIPRHVYLLLHPCY